MVIKKSDLKILWAKSGNMCSLCKKDLVTQGDSNPGTVLGEQAHIVAREYGGPRGDYPISHGERNSYSNLILLCPTDHRLIDKAPGDYPVEELRLIKSKHEAWVRSRLVQGSQKKLTSTKPAPDISIAFEAIKARLFKEAAELLRLHGKSWSVYREYGVYCSLAVLAGRSVNTLNSHEICLITSLLNRSVQVDPVWKPSLMLIMLVHLDYFEVHGMGSDLTVSLSEAAESVRNSHPSSEPEALIIHLPMSAISRRKLQSSRD